MLKSDKITFAVAARVAILGGFWIGQTEEGWNWGMAPLRTWAGGIYAVLSCAPHKETPPSG